MDRKFGMLNPPMAKGDATPNRFFQFFSDGEELFLQTKLLPVGSSLGHLSMKNFLDQTYRLASKIRQREGAGKGVAAPPPPLSKS